MRSISPAALAEWKAVTADVCNQYNTVFQETEEVREARREKEKRQVVESESQEFSRERLRERREKREEEGRCT